MNSADGIRTGLFNDYNCSRYTEWEERNCDQRVNLPFRSSESYECCLFSENMQTIVLVTIVTIKTCKIICVI